ncbi:MAG: hydrogenase expression/formation protein HypE [Anaerolineales bacterium]|nr:MAG: hydrogenase expression/formation protein HypE [Anaerolineales bacterium]
MNQDSPVDFSLQCPIPISDYPTVLLAHGGGGRLTQMLIERMFLPAFDNPVLENLHDGAVLDVEGARLAFSTDSFVISPLFFPGGDIGSLAVHGTLNDLAMCGARPLYLSAGLILEEGLPMEDLWRVVQSMQGAARRAGVPIVTGDTKVVDRGKGDGVFINTTGLGLIPPGIHVSPRRARPGDVVLINGAIAVHGMAVMSVREGLEFETALESDSASLHDLVARVLDIAGEQVHVLRDPTRGGVASALNEIAAQAQAGILLGEATIPIWEEVRGACEILGLDPLYVANEGKCLVIVAQEAAEAVLAVMRDHPLGQEAAIIGEIVEDHPGRVFMRSRIGGMRVVDMLSGEQLPRIC